MVVVRELEEERREEGLFNGDRVSVGRWRALEGGCPAGWIYLMLLNCTLTIVKIVSVFHYVSFTTINFFV